MRSLEDVGQALGLRPGEAMDLLKEVRQNHALLNACTRHQFPMPLEPYKFGSINRRHTCVHCGGTMRGEEIKHYENGVLHAGAPFKVWLDPELPKD